MRETGPVLTIGHGISTDPLVCRPCGPPGDSGDSKNYYNINAIFHYK
jgi:hypothetical protein